MRLTRAALLTLRRRHALMIWAGVLAIGVPLVVELILAILHMHDPVVHRPAGGSHTFARMTDTIDLALVVMAAIVGATTGAGDLSAGTFRDLVASGCPRRALFLSRVPAALAVSVSFAVGGVGVIIVACYALADGTATPTPAQALGVAAHVLAAASVTTVLTVGLAELVGSRGITIGVLLGWLLAGEQLLQSVSILGQSRDALLSPALDRLRPLIVAGDTHFIPMSVAVACATIVAWAAVAVGAGVWRVETRDA
jgi:ABC-type transport system involved in multi-copper enzyme maturation permease subunit